VGPARVSRWGGGARGSGGGADISSVGDAGGGGWVTSTVLYPPIPLTPGGGLSDLRHADFPWRGGGGGVVGAGVGGGGRGAGAAPVGGV